MKSRGELSQSHQIQEVQRTEQLRELERRLSTVEDDIRFVTALDTTTEDIVPTLVNFVNNSDFLYSEEIYNTSNYTGDNEDYVLASWYARSQSETDSWEENTTGTEATNDSIRSSSHSSGLRTGVKWDTGEGVLKMSGGQILGHKLQTKHAYSGNFMAFRCQLSLVAGEDPPPPNLKMKVSIWDNTDNRILRGSKPSLSLTKIGHTGGETVTREYILEVQMPDGRKFYSNTVTPDDVTNTVATTSVNSTKYVNVSWDDVIGSSRYRVYRRTPSETDTAWYLVGTITNGTTQISDFGGTGGGVWEIPTLDVDNSEYQYAQGFYDDIGELLQEEEDIQEVAVVIRVPFNFTPNGNQFLQIEFVNEDYSNTDTGDIPQYSIRVDRIGLGYSNGRWAASPRDLLIAASITVNPPPSTGTGGGNTSGNMCVESNTPVLVWDDNGNHTYVPANEIVKGDRLVAWDDRKEQFVPTLVHKVIVGISTANYIVHSENYSLPCSFSHPCIADFDDFKTGTSVRKIKTVLEYTDGKFTKSEVLAKEILNVTWKVITFVLSRKLNNYIANGIACHNLKPEPPT